MPAVTVRKTGPEAFCALAAILGVVIVLNVFERTGGYPGLSFDSSPVIGRMESLRDPAFGDG